MIWVGIPPRCEVEETMGGIRYKNEATVMVNGLAHEVNMYSNEQCRNLRFYFVEPRGILRKGDPLHDMVSLYRRKYNGELDTVHLNNYGTEVMARNITVVANRALKNL